MSPVTYPVGERGAAIEDEPLPVGRNIFIGMQAAAVASRAGTGRSVVARTSRNCGLAGEGRTKLGIARRNNGGKCDVDTLKKRGT